MGKIFENAFEEQANVSHTKLPKLTVGFLKSYLKSLYKNSTFSPLTNIFNHYSLEEIKTVAKKLPKDLRENAEALIANNEKDKTSNEKKRNEVFIDPNLVSDPIKLRQTLHKCKNTKNSKESRINYLEEEINSLYQKIDSMLHALEVEKEEKSLIEAKIEYLENHRTIDLVWDLDYILEGYFSDKYYLMSYIRISDIDNEYDKWIKCIWSEFPNIVIKDKIIAISKIIEYCYKISDKTKIRIYCPEEICTVVKAYVTDLTSKNFITK